MKTWITIKKLGRAPITSKLDYSQLVEMSAFAENTQISSTESALPSTSNSQLPLNSNDKIIRAIKDKFNWYFGNYKDLMQKPPVRISHRTI